MEESVQATRLTLNAEDHDTVTMFAGQDSVADIFGQMSQHAINPQSKRLVTVRDAEKLGKSLTKLGQWLNGAANAQVYVMMVSNKPDWPSDFMPEVRAKVVGSASSIFVECKLPAGRAIEAAGEIIASHWCPRLSIDQATFLAKRTNCDLARCRDASIGLNSLPENVKITEKALEKMVTPTPSSSFADALTSLDKAEAANLARDIVEQGEVYAALLRLRQNLMHLEAINRTMRPVLQRINDRSKVKVAIQETSKAANVPLVHATRLWDYAKHYDVRTVSVRTEALIRADENKGAPGVLETLVTEW